MSTVLSACVRAKTWVGGTARALTKTWVGGTAGALTKTWVGGTARALTAVGLALGIGAPTHSAAPAPQGADSLFGIRLGVALTAQLGACAMRDGQPPRLDDLPCWAPDSFDAKARTVMLPRRSFLELGLGSVRRVREVGGVVVEIEIDFMPGDEARLERQLRRQHGAPASSETIQRDSRIGGVRNETSLAWRSNGATLWFSERSSGDRPRVRTSLDRWAEQHAREEKARRDEIAQSQQRAKGP